jgi:hypothetical protein
LSSLGSKGEPKTNHTAKSVSVHKFNPVCKVFDSLHTGVRNAADYLAGNYVNLPSPYEPPDVEGSRDIASEVNGRKTLEGISKADGRLAGSI